MSPVQHVTEIRNNDAVASPALSSIAESYVAAKRAEDAASAVVKAAGTLRLATMNEQGVTGLQASGATISRVAESTSSSLDVPAALASIEQLTAIVQDLAARLAAHGEDVQIPADLGTLSYKARVVSASLRCKLGGVK